MENEMIEKYFIMNGSLMSTDENDKKYMGSSKSIYEVIRVISGVPLFLEKHMARLESSARLIGYSISPIADRIRADIQKLININDKPEKNIKIVVNNLESPSANYEMYFIKSSYPELQDYENGVHTILYEAERENPNAKVVNQSFKEVVAAALKNASAYEALLVNESQEITEGSRSNIFFVKGERVFTAPKGSVLLGITRVSILELCSMLGIEVVEKPISTAFLTDIDGLFITGTSPKVLPIKSVDAIQYGSSRNPVITKLMKAYDDTIEKYVQSYRG